MSTDERLAELLEGLLEPEAAAALEQDAHDDPLLGGRLEALRRALPDPVVLPPLELPPSLVWRVRAVVEDHLQSAEEHPRPDRARLAAALEGADDPALERALRDPRARAELLELARAFAGGLAADPALPPGLDERVLIRLEEERLVETDHAEAAAAPEGLLERTLARLEAEGLVASATPHVAQPAPLPARAWRPWLVAAALLLTVGAGLWAVYALGRRHERVLHQARPLAFSPPPRAWEAPERLRAAIREAREERDALRAERDRRAADAELAQAEAAGLREAAAAAEARAKAASEAARVAALRARALEAASVAAIESAATLTAHLAAAEASLAQEVEAHAASRRDRAREVAELRRERARLEHALERAPRELVVEAADGALRWSPERASWEPLLPGSELPPGSLVRGEGRGALVLSGRRYRLQGGAYVVGGEHLLEPLPDQGARAQAAASRSAPLNLDAQVQGWVADLGSGSPRVRSHAQRELLELYERLGDPGPGVVEQWVRVDQGPPGVPLTAREWLAWWERVDPGALK